jgi:hypothetical protein
MRISLKESERDLLRTADASFKAAEYTLTKAEAAWKEALALVLKLYRIRPEKMETLALTEDYKFLEYQPKETQ